jgi:hypothetical protein
MNTEAPPFKEREDEGMEVNMIEGGGVNNDSPNGNAGDEE